MNKNCKKFIAAGGSLVLSLSLLAACGGSDKSSSKSDSSSSQAGDNTITIMSPYIDSEPPAKDNQIQTALEKLTGQKMDMTWVANSSYADKFNVTLASGDLPEIMVVQGKTAAFVKSAESGAFWDLTNYLKDYDNLAQANKTTLKSSSVNGKVYGIYRSRDTIRSAVIIRKDWLKKLGLEVPKTTEDLYNIAKAFTEDDPDGNGINDTVGLNIPKWESMNNGSIYDIMALWYGAGNSWVESKNGDLEPSFMSSAYLDSLTFIKKMVDEGLVNSDYATLSTDSWNDNFINGKAGIIIDTYSRGNTLANTMDVADSDDYVVMTGNLEGPDGNIYAWPTDGYSGMLAITKSSVKTKAQLKKVLSFINDLNSKDAQVLLNNGIEGVNFKLDDGFTVAIDSEEAEKVKNAVTSLAQIGTNVTTKNYIYTAKPTNDATQAVYDNWQTTMKADLDNAVFNPAAAYISETYTTKGTELDTIILDARIKYIAGQIDKNGWKDALELWKKSGGSEVISEMTKLSKTTK